MVGVRVGGNIHCSVLMVCGTMVWVRVWFGLGLVGTYTALFSQFVGLWLGLGSVGTYTALFPQFVGLWLGL